MLRARANEAESRASMAEAELRTVLDRLRTVEAEADVMGRMLLDMLGPKT